MAAPDKIYLQELSDGTWDDCFVYESSETDANGKKRVPYIRKDALLEWAKEQMRLWEDRALDAIHSDTKYPIIVGTFGLKRDMFKMFIDKLNEM